MIPVSIAGLTTQLARLVDANEARISIWMGGLDGTCWLANGEHAAHPAASTLKLPLIAVHRTAEQGELSLQQPLPVHDEFASAVPGATHRTTYDYANDPEPWARLGAEVSVGWLAERAIVMSSNLATNLLIELVGIDAVTAGRLLGPIGTEQVEALLAGCRTNDAIPAGTRPTPTSPTRPAGSTVTAMTSRSYVPRARTRSSWRSCPEHLLRRRRSTSL